MVFSILFWQMCKVELIFRVWEVWGAAPTLSAVKSEPTLQINNTFIIKIFSCPLSPLQLCLPTLLTLSSHTTSAIRTSIHINGYLSSGILFSISDDVLWNFTIEWLHMVGIKLVFYQCVSSEILSLDSDLGFFVEAWLVHSVGGVLGEEETTAWSVISWLLVESRVDRTQDGETCGYNIHWQGSQARPRSLPQVWSYRVVGGQCQASCLSLLR